MPVTSRHTRQRQVVLWSVKAADAGRTPEQVWQDAQRLMAGIGRATVYRNLELLTGRGEIYRFEGEDGVRRYFGHVFHQANFSCQRCGQQRRLSSQTLNQYVDRKIFGNQTVFLSRLIAQGLCASCTRRVRRQGVRI